MFFLHSPSAEFWSKLATLKTFEACIDVLVEDPSFRSRGAVVLPVLQAFDRKRRFGLKTADTGWQSRITLEGIPPREDRQHAMMSSE